MSKPNTWSLAVTFDLQLHCCREVPFETRQASLRLLIPRALIIPRVGDRLNFAPMGLDLRPEVASVSLQLPVLGRPKEFHEFDALICCRECGIGEPERFLACLRKIEYDLIPHQNRVGGRTGAMWALIEEFESPQIDEKPATVDQVAALIQTAFSEG